MFTEPMLARAIEESDLDAKNWDGWVMEPKHDGMRAIIHRTADGVEIYSRTGKSQKGKCPQLELALLQLPVDTILDGELAIATRGMTTVRRRDKRIPVVDFNKTMRVMGSNPAKAVQRQKEFGDIKFIMFDVLRVGGIDSMHLAQEDRMDISDGIAIPGVLHNPQFAVDKETYDEWVKAGIEGAILKELTGVYLPGKRSKDWLKVKSAKTFDVIVTGFTDGQGKYTGQIGAIEFSAYTEDGKLQYVGRCSGMTDAERRIWTDYSISDGAFQDPVVIEVKANEMVGSGEFRTPRHPQYQHVRVDKNAQDCTMEQFRA